MANQRKAAYSGDNGNSFLEDMLDMVDCLDCVVDRLSQKCAITHDILLALARTAQIVKSGIEALMEIDDEDDNGGEYTCQECRNWRRS